MSYQFKHPFEYHLDGNLETSQFLEMSKPSGKHINEVIPIKNALMKAMAWATEQHGDDVDAIEAGDGDVKVPGSSIIQTMEMCPDIDMIPVVHCTMHLLTKGKLGMIDGETKLTQKIVDDLDIADTYGIVGEFISDFIMPSL